MQEQLLERYKARLAAELGIPKAEAQEFITKEYEQFRIEAMPKALSFYEKAAAFAGRFFKLSLSPSREAEVREALAIAHLDIKPGDSLAFAYFYPILAAIAGLLLGLLLRSTFISVFILVLCLGAIAWAAKLPDFFASKWRMRASTQMVLCIFYIVTYMRHTSNLERAISFAAEHLPAPLGLDMRWLIWAVEAGKYETVSDALASYLKGWMKWNPEFVDAFKLAEASLYEASEERRLGLLDKSLEVILDGTYERMLHFAHGLKGPLTALHMLGIVMPILGLVILPLVVAFMEEVRWWHIAALYNIALPLIVYSMSQRVLATRPTGYGELPMQVTNPQLAKYGFRLSPLLLSLLVAGLFALVAFSPLLIRAINPEFDICFRAECGQRGALELLGYRESTKFPGKVIGPHGLGASLLSLAFPLAVGFGFGLWYRTGSAKLVQLRQNARKLEEEFASALWQLGNKLADGIPLELAFEKVAALVGESSVGDFFRIVVSNIRERGLGVVDAIFHPKFGAVVYFPSAIIHSSMKVLVDAIRKGPAIAAQAMLNVAKYIREMHRVDERLKDLLAEIISDMKTQITFLTPTIAGIVIGIGSMISFILMNLTGQIQKVGQLGVEGAEAVAAGTGGLAGIAGLFGDPIPTYYFQSVVGIYITQIIALLTILSSGIENGADKLMEKAALGKNLIASSLTYVAIAGITMLVFTLIAVHIIAGQPVE